MRGAQFFVLSPSPLPLLLRIIQLYYETAQYIVYIKYYTITLYAHGEVNTKL
jgi:hypothetical protein